MASVASFFLSRIDSKVDDALDQLAAADEGKRPVIDGLKGKVAIANAKLAYQEYKKITQSDRWQVLVANGAKVQRLCGLVPAPRTPPTATLWS